MASAAIPPVEASVPRKARRRAGFTTEHPACALHHRDPPSPPHSTQHHTDSSSRPHDSPLRSPTTTPSPSAPAESSLQTALRRRSSRRASVSAHALASPCLKVCLSRNLSGLARHLSFAYCSRCSLRCSLGYHPCEAHKASRRLQSRRASVPAHALACIRLEGWFAGIQVCGTRCRQRTEERRRGRNRPSQGCSSKAREGGILLQRAFVDCCKGLQGCKCTVGSSWIALWRID
jgi:hypothetical protein